MAALEESAPTQDEEVAAMFDLSKMKKKKKKKKAVEEETAKTDSKYANYTYDELLDRVAKIIQEKNPELGEKRRHTMKPPQLMRIGTKKTLWVNYAEICKAMNRSPEHVFQYFMAELGTDGSIDGTQRLIIKGKYMPKYIESLLRKYIVEYVTCQMCRSPQTSLTRDPTSRLYFLHCQNCGSSRSVTPSAGHFRGARRMWRLRPPRRRRRKCHQCRSSLSRPPLRVPSHGIYRGRRARARRLRCRCRPPRCKLMLRRRTGMPMTIT